jgi:hypothetical protein
MAQPIGSPKPPARSADVANQWEVNVEIRVHMKDTKNDRYMNSAYAVWNANIPLMSISAVNYSELVRAKVTEAVERLREELAAEQAQETGV